MNAYLLPATTQTIITPQLLERGLLTPDQLSEVLSTATSGRLSEEATIAKLGLLSREDLRETVLGKVKWITTELIEAASVRFRVSRLNRLPGQAKSDDSEKRRFKILLEELEGKAWGEMAAEQESFMECLPQLSQRPDLLANNLGLSDDSEQFLSECIDGESTLKAVYRATNLTRAKSFATVFALHQLGHLTFATLHTSDVAQTVNRIVDVFPAHQQQQIRTMLSFTLQSVVCQQLIPRATGKGRALAAEIMVCNPAIRALVRDNKAHQIMSIIQTGGAAGMRTMNQSLFELYRAGAISYEDAIEHCNDPADFQRLMERAGSSGSRRLVSR